MKQKKFILKLLFWFIFLITHEAVYSQNCTFPEYSVVFSNTTSNISWTTSPFRNRSTQADSNTWIKITWVGRSSTNVSISNFDLTNPYGYAWQPTINFPRATSSTDTSWAEFLVEFFSDSGLTTSKNLPCLAMTIVDCDGSGNTSGSNSYREMVKVSTPVVPNYISGSQVTNGTLGNWEIVVSGFPVFNTIDTNDRDAMIQMDFDSVSSFNVQIGLIGTQSLSSWVRQFSFHFKPFNLPSLLPINLLKYEINKLNNFIQLKWTTSSEINNKLFEVERRINEDNWYCIGQLSGNDITFTTTNYSFIDYYPKNGILEYRLKQIDNNNNFIYKNLGFIEWGNLSNQEWQINPNPFNNSIEIIGGLTPHNVTIINQTGSVLLVSKGKRNIDVSLLKSGIYYVKVSSNNENYKTFIMIKK